MENTKNVNYNEYLSHIEQISFKQCEALKLVYKADMVISRKAVINSKCCSSDYCLSGSEIKERMAEITIILEDNLRLISRLQGLLLSELI